MTTTFSTAERCFAFGRALAGHGHKLGGDPITTVALGGSCVANRRDSKAIKPVFRFGEPRLN